MSDLFGFVKPDYIDDITEKVKEFIASFQYIDKCKIVLVTSGGTSVPLERNAVRFLDNFSTGSRGAASTEQFLKQGYKVIFLHRQGSLCPFQRFIPDPHSLIRSLKTDVSSGKANSAKFYFTLENAQDLSGGLKDCNTYDNNLLSIPFTTLDDYLHLLKCIAILLKPLKQQAIIYLAAAVSDFFIPHSSLPEHKIQSCGEDLILTLKPVPKIIKDLTNIWACDAFVVTFKLETNEAVLIQKSHAALAAYSHQVVIANILNSRKRKVLVITKENILDIELSQKDVIEGVEIEQLLIEHLARLHEEFICQRFSKV